MLDDAEIVPATPARSYSPMRAQLLEPWTVARLMGAAWAWLIAESETELPRETIPVTDERPST
jgi:hypothetical protein